MDSFLDRLRPYLARIPIEALRNPAPVVAVLRLSGPIGAVGGFRRGLSLARLAPVIERAFKLANLKAVALAINSPGGSAVQSALIAQRIRVLAAEREVPVIAFVEDVAASGGYWLACAADEIFAQPSSIVGSIGVIAAGFGAADLIGRLGIQRRVYTAGARKAMLDPFRPENADDVARLHAIQADIHGQFQDWVRERRGLRLKGSDDELFSGEFWTGRRGLELGLVDGLDDLRAAMRKRFGERVALRLVSGERGLWRMPWRVRAELGEALVEETLTAIETRALWQRYGL